MFDLSPGAILSAVIIFGLSGSHVYLWNRKRSWRKLVGKLLLSSAGLIFSIVPFALWQAYKKRPEPVYHQYVYPLALVVPWAYGLSVEVSICYLSLNVRGAMWRTTRWSIVIIALIAIGLQFSSLLGGVFGAEKRIHPPFVGNIVFHSMVTIIFGFLPAKYPILRHRKLVAYTGCFAVALLGDIVLLSLHYVCLSSNAYTRPRGPIYLIPCFLEVAVLSLLLLVRLNPRFLHPAETSHSRLEILSEATLEQDEVGKWDDDKAGEWGGSLAILEKGADPLPSHLPSLSAGLSCLSTALTSHPAPENNTGPSNATTTPQLVHITSEMEIRDIIEIKKTKDGVSAWVLVESRCMRRLIFVNWRELYNHKEVEMLVCKDTRNLASRLSSVKGSWDQPLFVKW